MSARLCLTRGVMVWGSITIGSRLHLVFLDRSMASQSYINNVIQPVALPFLQQLQNPTFQQDNARRHTAAVTRDFLRQANVTTLPRPVRSPDLSPIEHVWDMI
nr:unnamed protein product [Callosobruchus chinensis]